MRVHHHRQRRHLNPPELLSSSANSHKPWTSDLFKKFTILLHGVNWKGLVLYPSWRTTLPSHIPITPNIGHGQPTAPQYSHRLQEYHSGDFQGLLLLIGSVVKQWMRQPVYQPFITPINALPQAQARLQPLLQQQCVDFSSSDNLTADPYKGYRVDTLSTLLLPASNS